MNKVYKIVKNHSTGCMTAVSELAKGAKKGSKIKLTILALANCASFSAFADAYTVANDISLTDYNNVSTQTVISATGSHTLDLSNLASIEKGEEVTKHTIYITAHINDLYTLQKEIAAQQTEVTELSDAYDVAATAYQDAYDSGTATAEELAALLAVKESAETAYTTASTQLTALEAEGAEKGISSLTVNDPDDLIGGDNDNAFIEKKEFTYKDVVTGKTFKVEVIDNLTQDTSEIVLSDDTFKIEFYEKQDNQYDSLNVVQIVGDASNTTTVDINEGVEFSAISKDVTQIISVGDNVELNFNADVSYYTGGTSSVSEVYTPPDNLTETIEVSEVTYNGEVVIDGYGTVNVTDAESFNEFNAEFLAFIKSSEELRLKYPNEAAMQAYYEAQIAKVYSESYEGSIDVTYTPTDSQVDEIVADAGLTSEFEDKVTSDDTNDMGLKEVVNNAFVALTGSGSTVTVAENVEIKNYVIDSNGDKWVSSGAVIKGDYTASGSTENNSVVVKGTIDAAGGTIISAKNLDLDVESTGKLSGNVIIINNDNDITINNAGTISGSVIADNGTINNASTGTITNISGYDNLTIDNYGTVTSNVTISGDNANIINNGNIGGDIYTSHNNATIVNSAYATIGGVTTLTGANSSFVNNGLSGGIVATNGAEVTNNHVMLNSDEAANISSGSSFKNNGDIYVGYTTEGTAKGSAAGSVEASANSLSYSAITVSNGSTFSNVGTSTDKASIFLASTQSNVKLISILNGGNYEDNAYSYIGLNPLALDLPSSVSTEYGNNNIALYVEGENTDITVNSTIDLNGSGGTGLYVNDGAQVTLNGTINLNNPLTGDDAIRSFGAWVRGNGSLLTLADDAEININADRGIGVHIRNGASLTVDGDASINFAADKSNQIGVLVSGISENHTSVNFTSNVNLELAGIDSILFRIERGAAFDTSDISGITFSTGNAENGTLFVVTNGKKASDDDEDLLPQQTTFTITDGTTLNVNSDNATGIRVEGGASAAIEDGVDIVLSGSNSVLAKVDGHYYDLNGVEYTSTNAEFDDVTLGYTSTLTSYAKLSMDDTSASGITDSVGYYLTNAGILEHYGIIDFLSDANQNAHNTGVLIENGGTLNNHVGAKIEVQGIAIDIVGSTSTANIVNDENSTDPVVVYALGNTSDVSAAYRLSEGGNVTITGAGITKADGNAHGIYVAADSNSSKIVLNGTVISLTDATSATSDPTYESTGSGIENVGGSSSISFTNNATINVQDGYGIHSAVGFSQSSRTSGTINVYGSGTGIQFEGIDSNTSSWGGSTTNAISNTGYENVVVNVYAEDGKGIYVNSTQNVTTSASVNIISEDGQAALIVEGTTEVVAQSGKLHSANADSEIVELNDNVTSFTNSGELLFGTFSSGEPDSWSALSRAEINASSSDYYALKTDSTDAGMTFTNNGTINGVVELLSSAGNTVTLGASSSGNVFRTGDGDDTFVVNRVTGSDADDSIAKFTQLDGGDGFDTTEFTSSSDVEITKDTTLVDIDYITLSDSSKVTLNNINTDDGLNTGTQTYNISDSGSILTYIFDGENTSFDRELAGAGTFVVNLTDNSNWFAFDKNAIVTTDSSGTTKDANNGGFTGTLELTNVSYSLTDTTDNNNTEALTNATLKASDDSYILVGEGNQEIGGLYFNGGTVDFGEIDYVNHTISEHHISVSGDLRLSGGNVEITTDISEYNHDIPTTSNILDHGVLASYTKLVSVDGSISGSAASVKLIDEDGEEICTGGEDSQTTHIEQNGEEVARATYGVRLVTTGDDGDGLYVGYGLTQIELKVKNDSSNALIIDGTDSTSSELDAYITNYQNDDGTYSYGDIQIQGATEITFSNTNNDYLGATHVTENASLVAGDDGVLGNTYKLYLDEGGSFDLAGYEQTIGSLIAHSDGSTVNLNGGTLTISGQDYTAAASNVDSDGNLVSYIGGDTLIGSGSLIFGNSSLTRADSASPVTYIYADNTSLSADVTNAANSTIYLYSYGGLGTGTLLDNGILNLILNTDGSLTNSALTGSGVVNKSGSGTLTFAEAEQAFAGTINVDAGAMIFDGTDSADEDNVISFAASDINVGQGTTVYAINDVTLAGNVTNSGAFYVGELSGVNASTFTQSSVTIGGDYVGETGSSLYFSGIINGDNDSDVNILNILGSSSGESTVYINKIGGLGAQTINGIELINVADSSDAEFIQGNRVIAGAYDYTLQRSESNSNNWVLMSDLTARPEVGSYIGNISTANSMFNLRLHDRIGETQYTDFLTGEEKITSMWLRHQYGYNKYKAANGDLSNKDSWNITQLGGDIAQWSSDGLNRLHIGLMAGYGRSTAKSHSTIDGAKAKGTVDGYSYGAYATWYDNDEDKTGLHVDTWVLWNDFNASVKGEEFSEKYDMKGLTASVEVGYSYLTDSTLGNYDLWLQPKGQLIWNNVKSEDHTESNGTRVSNNHGNLQTRLGLRASLLSNAKSIARTNTAGQMFVEANWLHNSKLYSVTMNDEVTIKQDGARNIAELKVGIEGNISKNHNVWFNLSGQRGDHSYENAAVMLGYKYSF